MGKEKYLKKIEELFKNSPVVSARSISRIVKDRNYTKNIIRNLILKNKINRLTKGYYTSYDDPSLLVFCFQPAYLGLQDALSFHNMWEQETIPIIITTRKVRQGIRNLMGTNVLIRRIDKKYFFGFEYHKVSDFYLPYSDREKTIIDMIYFKEKLDKAIIKKTSRKNANNYLKTYSKNFRNKFCQFYENGGKK